MRGRNGRGVAYPERTPGVPRVGSDRRVPSFTPYPPDPITHEVYGWNRITHYPGDGPATDDRFHPGFPRPDGKRLLRSILADPVPAPQTVSDLSRAEYQAAAMGLELVPPGMLDIFEGVA